MAIEHLIIMNDPQLSYCHVQAVCEHLNGSPEVTPTIMNNAIGCISKTEILSFCDLSRHSTQQPFTRTCVFPNPVKDTFRISVEGPIRSVQIHYATLRHILSATDNTIDLSALPAGHYMGEVRTDRQVYRRSFLKQKCALSK